MERFHRSPEALVIPERDILDMDKVVPTGEKKDRDVNLRNISLKIQVNESRIHVVGTLEHSSNRAQ